MQDYRKLRVWQIAYDLTLEVYRSTRSFPREELYGLTSQIRRSCSSIPFNLAEGCARRGDAELARFVSYALGSASELDNQLLLARDLELIDPSTYEGMRRRLSDVRRMLVRLLQKVEVDSAKS